MKDLATIVAGWLRENGYDGLYNDQIFCACEADDIMPCGDPSPNFCKPGYRVPCTPDDCEAGGGCGFHIASRRATLDTPTEGETETDQ